MTDEIKTYFMQRYKEASFRVVPGHWPDFKSKDEVNNWIGGMEKITEAFSDAFQNPTGGKA